MSKLPAQPNQSLQEGLELLVAVARSHQPVGVRELGRELGLSPSRVQRYLATLAHLGLTHRNENGKYGVGPGIHALSAISLTASGLALRAVEVLPALDDIGGAVALGVLWRKMVSYLYFHQPGLPVHRALGRMADYPARESAIGRVMLASADEEMLRRDYPDAGRTFLAQLAQVRRQGFARIDRANGDVSLAVAVGSPPIAALAISAPLSETCISETLPRLRAAADALLTPETEELP